VPPIVGDQSMSQPAASCSFQRSTTASASARGLVSGTARQDSYSIYQHLRDEADYILRTTKAAPPRTNDWRRIATVQPDGTCSFIGQSTEFQAWWERQLASVR
jgi:hypothetical protein